MTKIKYLLYFLIAFILNACCCGGNSSVYQFYDFYNFFVDKNNTVYIKSKYNFDEDNKTFYLAQNKESHQWYEVNITNSHDEKTIIIKNKIFIKDNKGSINYEAILPTIEEIANHTNINLLNSKISYIPFKAPYQENWDKKRVIASVLTDRVLYDSQNETYQYHTIYNFSLLKEDSSWNMEYINKESSEEGYLYDKYSDILTPPHHNSYEEHGSLLSKWILSTDEKASICYISLDSEVKCFSHNENKIVVKKLFGEIYPKEYQEILQKYMDRYKSPSSILYFFDNNNNMHLFYNDTANSKGKYFNYVMFGQDEPTLPKYEQKIERR